MLKRINLIANVGQFVEAKGTSNDLRFEPLTLIYGANGRGKTTITAVLWSLATGDKSYLTERRCLWGTGDPKVIVQGTSDTAIFDNGEWNRTVSRIHVFDDEFIETNVATHRVVSLDQRRKLHEVVLGEGNVLLSSRVLGLTDEIRELTQVASASEKEIKAQIRGSMTVSTFCALSPVDGIDAVIASKERGVIASKSADPIKLAQPLRRVALPGLHLGRIGRTLSKTLTDLNVAAEARTRAHFASLGSGGEAWVERGLSYPHDKQCPFCAQSMAFVSAIRDFKAYFSAAYAELKTEIASSVAAVEDRFGGNSLARAMRELGEEGQSRAFWKAFTPVANVSIQAVDVEVQWVSIRDRLLALLKTKAENPLEPVTISEDVRTAAMAYLRLRRQAVRDLRVDETVSKAIARLKREASTSDTATAIAALDRAINVKTRHGSETSALCDRYAVAIELKGVKTSEKETAVVELGKTSSKLLTDYQTTINAFLDKFAAGFRLAGFKRSAEAGAPGCTYHLDLQGHRVEVADPRTPRGQVTSRTALSGGDRSTLALAFFLAKLLKRSSLVGDVVVLDDPVSSMDNHRKERTAEYIRALLSKGAQVVVLSHNAAFLRHVWTSTKGVPINFIEIVKTANRSTLSPWDIAVETDTDFHKVFKRLSEFVIDPKDEPNDARVSIRFLLEGYLRYHYPAVMEAGERLGQFIEKARQARELGCPIISADRLTELQTLNDFSAEKAHLSDSSDAPGPPSVEAVQSYVRQAIAFIAPSAL